MPKVKFMCPHSSHLAIESSTSPKKDGNVHMIIPTSCKASMTNPSRCHPISQQRISNCSLLARGQVSRHSQLTAHFELVTMFNRAQRVLNDSTSASSSSTNFRPQARVARLTESQRNAAWRRMSVKIAWVFRYLYQKTSLQAALGEDAFLRM